MFHPALPARWAALSWEAQDRPEFFGLHPGDWSAEALAKAIVAAVQRSRILALAARLRKLEQRLDGSKPDELATPEVRTEEPVTAVVVAERSEVQPQTPPQVPSEAIGATLEAWIDRKGHHRRQIHEPRSA